MTGCRRPAAPAPPPAESVSPVPSHRLIAESEISQFGGSEACAACHAAEAAGHSASRHARTLTRVTPAGAGDAFRRTADLFDLELEVHLETRVKDGECQLVASRGSETRAVRADYAFGSGHVGVTYVARYRDQPVELRASYYPKEGRWEFTPGQQPQAFQGTMTAVGRILKPESAQRCFLCHSTALVHRQGQVQPRRSILGVGCEACHGPGMAHVEAVRRGDPDLRMPHLGAFRERVSLELCGQCHRAPGDGAQVDEAQIARFQGVALSRSACFRRSAGQLSCLSCHDPHHDADRTPRARYNAVCSGCHAPAHPGQKPCKLQPQGDCVSCHMPSQSIAMPTQPTFRNHWIKVW